MYMSDSEDDDEFVATAADLAAAAEAASMPEEHNSDEDAAGNSDCSSGDEEVVGLALTRDMLPANVAIECLNTKTSWGRAAATITSRRCKISVKHCPPDGKVAVLPIEDLLPTSGGIQLDKNALWVTATRGSTIERYLLVAMELHDGPETTEWRLWQLPMATDQRLVKEIVASSGVEFTDDLKKKLIAASDPSCRSLAMLPKAVAAAFEEYGGLVYSSATYQKMKPRAAQAASAAAKPPQKATEQPTPQKPAALATAPTSKKRKPASTTGAGRIESSPPQKRPKPTPGASTTPTPVAPVAPVAPVSPAAPAATSFTLTITATDPVTIARVLAAAQKPA